MPNLSKGKEQVYQEGKNKGSGRNQEVFWEQNFNILDLGSGEELSDEKERSPGCDFVYG